MLAPAEAIAGGKSHRTLRSWRLLLVSLATSYGSNKARAASVSPTPLLANQAFRRSGTLFESAGRSVQSPN